MCVREYTGPCDTNPYVGITSTCNNACPANSTSSIDEAKASNGTKLYCNPAQECGARVAYFSFHPAGAQRVVWDPTVVGLAEVPAGFGGGSEAGGSVCEGFKAWQVCDRHPTVSACKADTSCAVTDEKGMWRCLPNATLTAPVSAAFQANPPHPVITAYATSSNTCRLSSKSATKAACDAAPICKWNTTQCGINYDSDEWLWR